MFEVGAVIDIHDTAIHWHLPPGRSGGHIPDTRSLWEVVWENRDFVNGIAHTHPGSGLPAPSSMDLSTFRAMEAGLGRRLLWWIATEDRIVEVTRIINLDEYQVLDGAELYDRDPKWVHYLRHLSGMKGY